MRTLAVLVLVCLAASPAAISQSLDWTAFVDTLDVLDRSSDAAVAPDRSIYLAGVQYDPQFATALPGFLTRYSEDGAPLWRVSPPSDAFYIDEEPHVAVDESGAGYLLTNRWDSTIGQLRPFVSNYATDGSLVWERVLTESGPQQHVGGLAIKVNAGVVGVAGVGKSEACPGWFVAALDAATGAPLWTTCDSSLHGSATRLDLDDAGTIYVAGQDQIAGGVFVATAAAYSAGQRRWVYRHHADDSNNGIATALLLVPGGVLIATTGYRSSSLEQFGEVVKLGREGSPAWTAEAFGHAVQTYRLMLAATSESIFAAATLGPDWDEIGIARLGLDGSSQWMRFYSGRFGASAADVAADSAGNVYVAGTVWSDHTGSDLLALRYTPGGDLRWMARYTPPNPSNDWLARIVIDSSNRPAVAGTVDHLDTLDDAILLRYSSPPAPCPVAGGCEAADTNFDCQVDLNDLASVLATFGYSCTCGMAPENGDLDFDGQTTLQDLAILLSHFSSDCR